MINTMITTRNTVIVTLGLMAVLMVGSAYADDKGQPKILGKTYGEWSGKWWQWLDKQDPDPLTEQGFIDCSKGQQGAVWFLAGTDGYMGPIERECTVPEGKPLFFPLVSLEFHNGPGETFSEDDKRDFLDGILSDNIPGPFNTRACNLVATVDSIPILFTGAAIIRTQSPPFKLYDDPKAVSDGFWVRLDLSEGHHTLHIKGALCSLDGQNVPWLPEVDVLYNLTVIGNESD